MDDRYRTAALLTSLELGLLSDISNNGGSIMLGQVYLRAEDVHAFVLMTVRGWQYTLDNEMDSE